MSEFSQKYLTDNVSNAFFLLETMYENSEEYIVYYCGDTRNRYCGELLGINPSSKKALIGRNGIMHILPNRLFFDEGELKKTQQSQKHLLEEHKKKKNEFREFFHQNFDSFFPKTEIKWAKKLSQLEDKLNTLLLRELFGLDLQEKSSPMIRKLAQFIPGGQYLKGNVTMLALVTKNILKQDVDVVVSGKKVRFTVMIDGLDSQGYYKKKNELKPYFDKLADWFLPYDCICFYEIKAHNRLMKLDNKLILDYNTRLWKRK